MPRAVDKYTPFIKSSLHQIWTLLGTYPIIFYPFNALRSRKRGVPVTRKTDLSIEGFQRSGNNFAVLAFQHAQSSSPIIAHHLHAPAQIIKASQYRIPSIVLIRKPVDVVCSQVLRSPYITIDQSLRNYLRFYRQISPYRKNFTIGFFDDVITDFGHIINRFNRQFSLNYRPCIHSEENINAVFKRIDWLNQKRERGKALRLSRPSQDKAEKKRRMLPLFESRKFKGLTQQAMELYHQYVTFVKSEN